MDMQGTQGLGPGPAQGAQGLGAVNAKGSDELDERSSQQSTLMSLLLTVFRKELSRKLSGSHAGDAGEGVDASSSSSSSLYDATVMVMVSMVKIRCSNHLSHPH